MFTDAELELMYALLRGHSSSAEFYLDAYCAYTKPADIFHTDTFLMSVLMLSFVASYNKYDVLKALKAAYPKQCLLRLEEMADSDVIHDIFVGRILARCSYQDILAFIESQKELLAETMEKAAYKLDLFNLEDALQRLRTQLPNYYPHEATLAIELPAETADLACASVEATNSLPPNWLPVYLLQRNNTHRALTSRKPVVPRSSVLSMKR